MSVTVLTLRGRGGWRSGVVAWGQIRCTEEALFSAVTREPSMQGPLWCRGGGGGGGVGGRWVCP